MTVAHLQAAYARVSTEASRRWMMTAAVIASGMAFIDATALNVAMPALQNEFGVGGDTLFWIINGYGVPLAALLLAGGALGDKLGPKTAAMGGIGLFCAASIACGLSPGAGALVGARVVQGLGAALMIPASLAMIAAGVPLERRGRAIGIWTAGSVVATALGPVLGGFLADAGLWRCVFLINGPLSLAALVVLHWRVPGMSSRQSGARTDWAGALAAAAGLGGVNYALLSAGIRGLAHPLALLSLAAGLAALGAFVAIERRSDHPLLPLALFRVRDFSAACLVTLALYSALYAMTFFLPLNLVQVQRYNARAAGLAQLPLVLLVVLISPLAGRLADRCGPRRPLIAGSVVAGFGFLLLAVPGLTAGPQDYWRRFLPALAVLGCAMGLTASPLSTAIINSVTDDRPGLASGINSTLSRLSGVLGIALLGPVALVVFQNEIAYQTDHLPLDGAERATLAGEAQKLAAAVPPASLPAEVQPQVQQAIQESFVTAFRTVALLCAGLGWLGALAAAAMAPSRDTRRNLDDRH